MHSKEARVASASFHKGGKPRSAGFSRRGGQGLRRGVEGLERKHCQQRHRLLNHLQGSSRRPRSASDGPTHAVRKTPYDVAPDCRQQTPNCWPQQPTTTHTTHAARGKRTRPHFRADSPPVRLLRCFQLFPGLPLRDLLANSSLFPSLPSRRGLQTPSAFPRSCRRTRTRRARGSLLLRASRRRRVERERTPSLSHSKGRVPPPDRETLPPLCAAAW